MKILAIIQVNTEGLFIVLFYKATSYILYLNGPLGFIGEKVHVQLLLIKPHFPPPLINQLMNILQHKHKTSCKKRRFLIKLQTIKQQGACSYWLCTVLKAIFIQLWINAKFHSPDWKLHDGYNYQKACVSIHIWLKMV